MGNIYKEVLAELAMDMNRRGQGMSVNTIILIIIGILVLVFLIVGFTLGWNKIFPFINPPNNVQQIADKCTFACSTSAKFDYCTANREVSIKDGVTILGKKETTFEATCFDLSTVTSLGINPCSIECDAGYSDIKYAQIDCTNRKGKPGVAGTADSDTIKSIVYTGGVFKCDLTQTTPAASPAAPAP